MTDYSGLFSTDKLSDSDIENFAISKKEITILDYIRENPNCTKQDVVDGLDGKYSRKPIFDAIKQLVKLNIIIIKKDKPNSMIHHLILNDDDIITKIITELDCFEKNFICLVGKTYEIELEKLKILQIHLTHNKEYSKIEEKMKRLMKHSDEIDTRRAIKEIDSLIDKNDDFAKVFQSWTFFGRISDLFDKMLYDLVSIFLVRMILVSNKSKYSQDIINSTYVHFFSRIIQIFLKFSNILVKAKTVQNEEINQKKLIVISNFYRFFMYDDWNRVLDDHIYDIQNRLKKLDAEKDRFYSQEFDIDLRKEYDASLMSVIKFATPLLDFVDNKRF